MQTVKPESDSIIPSSLYSLPFERVLRASITGWLAPRSGSDSDERSHRRVPLVGDRLRKQSGDKTATRSNALEPPLLAASGFETWKQ